MKAGLPTTRCVRHLVNQHTATSDAALLAREHDRGGYLNATRAVTSSPIVSEHSGGFSYDRSADVLAPRLDQGADVVRAVRTHLLASSFVGCRSIVTHSVTSTV